MGAYVATVNVPGYSPMDDDPPMFSTATAAWQYLRDERQRDLEQRWESEDAGIAEADEQDSALAEIETAIASGTGEAWVWGTGPSIEHDLGLAYSVTWSDEEEVSEDI